MLPKPLIILLTLAVAFAVGVCPCGLELVLGRVTGAMTRIAAVKPARPHCSACVSEDQKSSGSEHDSRSADRCATVVSGEMPTTPDVAPIHIAVPPVVRPMILAVDVVRSTPPPEQTLCSGLPPPPTLFDLGCCLTI